MAIENQGSSKSDTETPSVKPTYVPPGYKVGHPSGRAEDAGDQSRIVCPQN